MALKLINTNTSSSFQRILHNPKKCYVSVLVTRTTASKVPQSVLIEKCLEEPVIVVSENDDVDIIGPPDPVSNLRPVIRKRLLNETALQQRLREMQDTTQKWNQKFWALHNTNFFKERQEYMDKRQVASEDKRSLTPDEMSEFYKSFLDKNWENHLKYNFEWYKRNFTLLFLALRVHLEKNVNKLLR